MYFIILSLKELCTYFSLPHSYFFPLQHIPEKLSDVLELPRGTLGQLMVPTMLHLRSMVLPDYHQKNQDYVVTANLSPHFAWTVNKLNLLFNC